MPAELCTLLRWASHPWVGLATNTAGPDSTNTKHEDGCWLAGCPSQGLRSDWAVTAQSQGSHNAVVSRCGSHMWG
jgi:hypothetical protein